MSARENKYRNNKNNINKKNKKIMNYISGNLLNQFIKYKISGSASDYFNKDEQLNNVLRFFAEKKSQMKEKTYFIEKIYPQAEGNNK